MLVTGRRPAARRVPCGGGVVVVALVGVFVVVLSACAGPAAAQPEPPASGASGDFARSVDIGGRSIYLECHGANGPGRHTVVLISGYHDSGEAWGIDEIIKPPAVGPAVPVALARDHRVCTYDRPGTLRYVDGNPLTDRTTPVPQPRTATWPLYRDAYLNAVPPGTVLADPRAERIDIDAGVAQVLAAPAFSPVPIAVLTKTEPFKTTLPPPPGLTVADINQLYEGAQADLVALRPNTPHTIATGDSHYIQWQSPDLVVSATELVDGRTARGPG
jgi:hypothetical protein